ncbi:MAG: hypothetical protein B5M51_05300 [Anaerolinea sp. 4484_236]|nr:MAG: hypothetical protein B5M51_05300 [Anaerolinea sp. 4484_236]
MVSYKIKFKKVAEKDLRKIPKNTIPKIIKAIHELASNPRPQGVKKLKTFNHSYRIRVGKYRVLYTIEDKFLIIEVIRIRHRKDAYRR